MNIKNRDRKEAIDKLLTYILAKLDKEDDKTAYRDKLLNSYAYESGISIRTLREYTSILDEAGLIVVGAYYDPKIRLVGT